MKPQTIGRVLGIGVRIAGRMAGRALEGPAQPAGQRSAGVATATGATVPGQSSRAAGQAAGLATVRTGQATARGLKGFLRPFGRVGGILWLEVTGVFFLLFALAFGWYMWQSWSQRAHAGSMRNLWLSGIVMVVFLYLGASSFWRANKR